MVPKAPHIKYVHNYAAKNHQHDKTESTTQYNYTTHTHTHTHTHAHTHTHIEREREGERERERLTRSQICIKHGMFLFDVFFPYNYPAVNYIRFLFIKKDCYLVYL